MEECMSCVVRYGCEFAQKVWQPIKQVLVYEGHKKHPLFGPYPENVIKRIKMFELLNSYRRQKWTVSTSPGEELIGKLKQTNPEETLLVIPAGQSSNLDKVFTLAQTQFIKEKFFEEGGRGYFNCGSAYWT